MRKHYQIAFWIITFVVLTLSFGRPYGGYAQSFYFVTFLFPVILGTSFFYNSFLVPKYLLKKKYFIFIQYSLYTLVFSVYLEILVLTLSLIVFANYRYDQLNPRTTDIVFLTVVMYFLVFANTVVLLLQEYFIGLDKNNALKTEQEKLKKGCLIVKSERKNINVEFGTILYIESVGNYVKIIPTSGKPIMTKEKISTIEGKLPNTFIRIHRSILVNVDQITSFNKEWVNINDHELPISRKYKEPTLNRLEIV
jgi:hypothetical protein